MVKVSLTVLQASSGSEALSLLGTTDLDVVITDHVMPTMTGAELMQTISRLRPGMPMILATGYAELPETLGLKFVRLPKRLVLPA